MGCCVSTRNQRKYIRLPDGTYRPLLTAGLSLKLSDSILNKDPDALRAQLLHNHEQPNDLDDLHQAISLLEHSLQSTSISEYRRSQELAKLSLVLFYRYHCLQELSDLEQAISKSKEALELTSDDRSDKHLLLYDFAYFSTARFNGLGELNDLEQSISHLQQAVQLIPHDHPDKPSYLHHLGGSFIVRFCAFVELSYVERGISFFRNVPVTTADCPDDPNFPNCLAKSFINRFRRRACMNAVEPYISGSGDPAECSGPPFLNDLEDGISMHRETVLLTPDGHPRKACYLTNFAHALMCRFQYLGKQADLEEALARYSDAVSLTARDHPDRADYLNNLAECFLGRFRHSHDPSDLAEAISRHQEARPLTPSDHPNKPRYLTNFGLALISRFEHLGVPTDLQQIIPMFHEAVQLVPHSHPDKPDILINLARSFALRFMRLDRLGDLESSILNCKKAIDLASDGHPNRACYFHGLSASFGIRYSRLGEPGDLEQSISKAKEAIEFTLDNHPAKPHLLGTLGAGFLARFNRYGNPDDLEQAVFHYNECIKLIADCHPGIGDLLCGFGQSLFARFMQLGRLEDLEQSISNFHSAEEIIPRDNPNRAGCLLGLTRCIGGRFSRLGELSDLEQTIVMLKEALDLTPSGHPGRPFLLSSLADSLGNRFHRLGDLEDIEQAISRRREAIRLLPNGQPAKVAFQGDLARSFLDRFQYVGELYDLEQSISSAKKALRQNPSIAHKHHYLAILGCSLIARSQHLDVLDDLEESISALKDAVRLIPNGHVEKIAYLNILSGAHVNRFNRLGKRGDIEQAIATGWEAIELSPRGYHFEALYLSNLGEHLASRFQRFGDPSDFEQSISCCREALQVVPNDHPTRIACLGRYADTFIHRFHRLGDPNDLDQAISYYSDAACFSAGPTSHRFRASKEWISHARSTKHHSLLRAYSVAIGLLPQLAWIGLSLTHRYDELRKAADVAREGAAAALDLGQAELAVEWLEQGRSVVWGGLFQLRSSFDNLSSAYPEHANRLQRISAELENASATRVESLSLSAQSQQGRHGPSLEQVAERHRLLAIERDKLLQEIRGFEGFERFLLSKEYSELRKSAHSGPVVILNAAEQRCDALIVLADKENAIHVPLSDFTHKRSGDLHDLLKGLLRHPLVIPFGDRGRFSGLHDFFKALFRPFITYGDFREGKREPPDDFRWENILSPLWQGVVKPVLDVLGFTTPGELSRIFWCPTGPFTFLPIHAAGYYGNEYSEPGHKVFDFVISSYVPTLGILMRPNQVSSSGNELNVLGVPQPPSDGELRLPGVQIEMKRIKDAIKNSLPAQIKLVQPPSGTVEEVLDLMKDADWVHFACHGFQDAKKPTDSGLCLAKRRRLKLSDMVSLSRTRGGLAFLSACQTATGDKGLSDEAVHIAAGMLFAGYQGVVATMWLISDRVAPDVAGDVYEQLFRDGGIPDCREAARALHEAVGRLRERNPSFVEWIPFIHVGL